MRNILMTLLSVSEKESRVQPDSTRCESQCIGRARVTHTAQKKNRKSTGVFKFSLSTHSHVAETLGPGESQETVKVMDPLTDAHLCMNSGGKGYPDCDRGSYEFYRHEL